MLYSRHISTIPHILMDLTVLPSLPQHFDWKITSKAVPRGQSSVCTTSVQSQGLHFWRGAVPCFDSKEGYLFSPQRKGRFNGVLMGVKWCLDGILRFHGALMAFWWRFDDRIPLTPSNKWNGVFMLCDIQNGTICKKHPFQWCYSLGSRTVELTMLWRFPQMGATPNSWTVYKVYFMGNRIYKWIFEWGYTHDLGNLLGPQKLQTAPIKEVHHHQPSGRSTDHHSLRSRMIWSPRPYRKPKQSQTFPNI